MAQENNIIDMYVKREREGGNLFSQSNPDYSYLNYVKPESIKRVVGTPRSEYPTTPPSPNFERS